MRVVGSRSGVHSGRLEEYSGGEGASFLPTRPFVPGERVSVHALAGAGAATSGVSTTFTVAHQAAVSQVPFPPERGDPREVQHYRSAPAITPTTVRITHAAAPGTPPGYLFLAPYQAVGSPGPMIVEQSGALVWFHPLPRGWTATDFQVQQYEGRPVLSWWQGRVIRVGFGEGEDVLYDSSYRPIATIRAGNGYRADLHEIRITPQGTAWIDAFDPIHMSLAGVHGSRAGILTDSVIQEIDIRTGLVMWEWHALGHIAPRESLNPVPRGSYPWDYVHVNSIDPGPSGDVLLSARNTWTLYDVSIHTGAFRWRLGSVRSSFHLARGVRFHWQHDAEWQPGGLISVFDNGAIPAEERQTRGLLIRPDYRRHEATLVGAFVHPGARLLAGAQGNVFNVAGGRAWLLGYGELPNFTMYNPSGHVLLDGTLGRNVQDFRTYFAPWSGRPQTPPAVAAQAHGGGIAVQASWNGATEVASWQVLAGPSPGALAPVLTVRKHGFETSIQMSAAGPYVAVTALDASGKALGTSAPVRAP